MTEIHLKKYRADPDVELGQRNVGYASGEDSADERDQGVDEAPKCTDGTDATKKDDTPLMSKTVVAKIGMIAAAAVYVAFALYFEFGSEPSIRLLWMTSLAVVVLASNVLRESYGETFRRLFRPGYDTLMRKGRLVSWVSLTAALLCLTVFIFVDVFVNTQQPYNLVSGVGLVVYVGLFYVTSVDRAKVSWRPVLWGLVLQLLFALAILRWSGGYMVFLWLGEQVATFLGHTDRGAEFLFGAGYREHFFAFQIMSSVVFFSSMVSVLYYLGVMQKAVYGLAVVMKVVMGTTAGESFAAAANIFVSMVPANHLLSASVMSAPAALALSKLTYPETEKSRTTAKDLRTSFPRSSDANLLSAVASGAGDSISLIANIAVNLIAFIATLAFVNSVLAWFGERVGIVDPPLSFEMMCSYLLYPFALIMGVELPDCRRVAKLIGIKTFLNEFVAFSELGVLMKNRELFHNHTVSGGTWYSERDDIILESLSSAGSARTLVGGVISVRSEVLSTYALCGFANVGSIGIQLGALGSLAPGRRGDLAAMVVRAMVAGNVACFLTASIAGLFYAA